MSQGPQGPPGGRYPQGALPQPFRGPAQAGQPPPQQQHGQPYPHQPGQLYPQQPGQPYPQQQPYPRQQPYPQQQQQPYPQHPGQPAPQQQPYPQQPGQPPPQPSGYAGAPQQGYGPGAYAPTIPGGPVDLDPDRRRRAAGLALWIVAMVVGVVLNVFFYLFEIFFSKNPGRMLDAVLYGALFAVLPLAVYLFVPAIIDRYDPEPWWALAMAFLWGAIVATGFAGFINTGVDLLAHRYLLKQVAEVITPVVCAPFVEELMKGLAILGVFYFLRREFDGVVDGIIYATFCALGFAAVENISYYARADVQHVLGPTFFLRGMLAPWGHPLYTSMTGIGFGIARESSRRWVRLLAPAGGYLAGVTLHAAWNGSALVLGKGFLSVLPLWFCFVLGFFCIIVALVVRKGRTIREFLRDEVLLGNLSQPEVDLICSPTGRLQCTFSWRGATGRQFIGAGARLALSKWHTARAMRGRKLTISSDLIAPLRFELRRLRGELASRAPGR